jgi:TRAP-type C4-dicarboxylate transport system substrate-binding protein
LEFARSNRVAPWGITSVNDLSRNGDDFDSAQAFARCQVARDWLAGKFVDAAPRVDYDGAPFTMKVTGHPPETASVVREVFKPAFKVLERMSRGKILVDDRWGGSVHAERDGAAALRDGRTDFTPCYSGWDSDTYKMAQALRLPGLFASAELATAISEELYPAFFRQDVERQGIVMGRMKATSAFHLFSMQPIRALSDLKGLRIGSNDGIEGNVIRALGAIPVPMSSLEKQRAFAAGLVDAMHISDGPAEVFGIGTAARCRTMLGLVRNNTEFGMSKTFWHGLPRDLQRILHVWLRAEAQAECQVFYGLEGARARDKFRAAGCEFIDFSASDKAAVKSRVAPVIGDFVMREEGEGRPAASMIGAINSLNEKYRSKTPDQLMSAAISHPVLYTQ